MSGSSFNLKRRDFLKGITAGAAGVVVGPSLLTASKAMAADAPQWKLTGSHWGAFRARIENGRVAEIKPFELDTHPTDMLNGMKGMIYNPSRVRYPMVRVDWLKNGSKSDTSKRGDNRFVRVSWDKALDLFHSELDRVQKTYGSSALHAGQTGWRSTGALHSAGNHMQRAIAYHGSFTKKVGDYSTGAGQHILPYVLGNSEVYAQGTSWQHILNETKFLVLWANDPVKNLQVGWNCETHEAYPHLDTLKAKIASGDIRVISIDPVATKTQKFLGCEQMRINPQTDVALMMAIAHTLATEDLADVDFLDEYTMGYEKFVPYLMGKTEDKIEKTPEWAAKICGVPAEDIRKLARAMAADRTQLMLGWCVQRQQHGEQPYWMAAVLASMLGQIGLPGGGISYAHHYSSIGVPSSGAAGPGAFPSTPDKGYKPVHGEKFNGFSKVIPVARWVDSLVNPGETIDYNGKKVKLPEIKMMVFSGNNPWHHHQDRNRMKQAQQSLETVVSVDYRWTATCRFSDIVLPATTPFERNDIDVYGSYSARGIIAMQKLVEPQFEAKSDFEIFTELTKRFGKDREYTRGMNEMQWLKEIYKNCRKANKGKFEMPEFEKFWEEGFVEFGKGKPWVRHADFREDPEEYALGTASGLIEIYSNKIAKYGYNDCKGHPMWFEKVERSHGGPGSDKYPLQLQSCHPDQRLHSQLCESEEYRATYTVQGREPIYMSPEDAKARGIKDGDIVRVHNDRGQLLAGAVVTPDYMPGVMRIYEGAWYGPQDEKVGSLDTYGDPNTLSLDLGASKLSQATSAHTCIVEVEKFVGKAPAVTAFGGPQEVEA